MTTGSELIKAQANRKGRVALFGALGTAGLVLATASVPVLPWVVAIAGGVWTARKTWDWLRFRGEWGLRF